MDIYSGLPAVMSDAGIEQRFAAVHDLWSALLGVVGGCLCAYALFILLRGLEPATYAWLIAAAIAGAMIALVFVSDWHIRAGAIAALMVYVLSFVYLWPDPRTAIERARAIAGDRPYCIQVADGGADYRPGVSLADFSSLTMRAEGIRPSFQLHAVMAVGEKGDFDLYNWSYRNQDWMTLNTNGDLRTPVIRCRPQKDFLDTLPYARLTRALPDETTPIYVGKRAFIVPRQYRPQYSSGATMNFFARAPDFGPVPECKEIRDCIFNMVQVYLRPEPLKVWLGSNPRNRIREGNFESGFATTVECPDLTPHPSSMCAHNLLADGVLIRFNYPERDIPKWREMQTKLLALYRSFEFSPKR